MYCDDPLILPAGVPCSVLVGGATATYLPIWVGLPRMHFSLLFWACCTSLNLDPLFGLLH